MSHGVLLAALTATLVGASITHGETFLERRDPSDVRIATWNIYFSSIFPTEPSNRAAGFARAFNAIDADVWALQEVYSYSTTSVRNLLNGIQPLSTPQGWQVYKVGEHVIASKYPLSMTSGNTSPAGYREVAMAMVDLPDELFGSDLYLMNAHYRCCGGADADRQKQSDAFVNWMRDAKTPGGAITLPADTPMVLLGDFNIVEGPQPLETLLTGDIANQVVYGADAAPDWDGSTNSMVDARHDATGPDQYTWRDDTSIFDPGRLDYITYTDSVMTPRHSFVLNTTTMSLDELLATGLQANDSIYSAASWDHLPVVADFAVWGSSLAADFDGDRDVDDGDLERWKTGFGSAGGAMRDQGDANGDGVVDGSDFLIWQRSLTGAAGADVVPEPGGLALALGALATVMFRAPSTQRGGTGWIYRIA